MHFKTVCMLNFNNERNSWLTRQKPLNQLNTFRELESMHDLQTNMHIACAAIVFTLDELIPFQ